LVDPSANNLPNQISEWWRYRARHCCKYLWEYTAVNFILLLWKQGTFL